MLIMALDHTRDFFHAFSPKPTDLATTTPILFFSRWVTHFCAAIFVFLSGVSANLAGTRRTKKQLSFFLIKRGLWLIVVEFLLITFAITLDPLYHLLIFQIIWVIGVSMIVLGLLIWLPLPVIAVIGFLLFFGHDILPLLKLPTEGTVGFLWKFLFTAVVMFQPVDSTHSLLVLYTMRLCYGAGLPPFVRPDNAEENVIHLRPYPCSIVCCFKGVQYLWRSITMGRPADHRIIYHFVF
jgi:uncharacterized membrane protein